MSAPHLNEDPDLAFVSSRLRANRTLLLACVGLGVVGSGLYTLLVPPVYEARTTIILPAGSESGGAGALAASLGLPVPVGGSQGSLSMFAAILDSERMLNALVKDSGIERRKLREKRKVVQDAKASLIQITFRDESPERAIKLTQSALDALAVFNEELSLPSKSQRADKLRKELDAKMDQLRELEIRLQAFAERAKSVPVGLTDGDSETNLFTSRQRLAQLRTELKKLEESERATSNSLAQMEAGRGQLPTDVPQLAELYDRLRSSERDLALARAKYTDATPQVTDLQTRVNELRKQIAQETTKFSQAYQKGLVRDANTLRVAKTVLRQQIRELEIQVDVAPEEAIQLTRLRREFSVLEKAVEALTLQYESARMDQATDPNRWEVLDAPALGDKPVNKSFALNMGLGTFASLFVGLALALAIRPKS